MPMADDIAASFMGSKPAGPVEETDKVDHGAMLIKAVKANDPEAVKAAIRGCVEEMQEGSY